MKAPLWSSSKSRTLKAPNKKREAVIANDIKSHMKSPANPILNNLLKISI